MQNKYEKKQKGDLPVLAICYDFDKTLTPDDMQAQGYIQAVGQDVDEFWMESNMLASNHEMDQGLAYMYMMKKYSSGKILFTKGTLMEHGKSIQLFPGVEKWFDRTKEYGKKCGVKVEHYIISSGLKEMIEGTSVAEAGAFEKIYANSFLYDEFGVAIWPAQVINYTNKTQFLFRVEKGVLDIGDDDVNSRFAEEDTRVPFRNIVYIGDSATDIPCMKLVKTRGGYSIGVYNPETEEKTKVYQLIRDKRIDYFVPADYREGEILDKLICSIIEKTAKNEMIEKYRISCEKETKDAEQFESMETIIKRELSIDLIGSSSFKETHTIISELNMYDDFEPDTVEKLFTAGARNGQVRAVINDPDVAAFYNGLISKCNVLSEEGKKVRDLIDGCIVR